MSSKNSNRLLAGFLLSGFILVFLLLVGAILSLRYNLPIPGVTITEDPSFAYRSFLLGVIAVIFGGLQVIAQLASPLIERIFPNRDDTKIVLGRDATKPKSTRTPNAFWRQFNTYLPIVPITIAVVLLINPFLPSHVKYTTTPNPCRTPYATLHEAELSTSNECIGISDGDLFFDTHAIVDNTSLNQYNATKAQILSFLKKQDITDAQRLWDQTSVTNDAEMLIYLENARVLATGRPYINFIVGTILTGSSAQIGRDGLQGAYVAQKEYNQFLKLPGHVQVRLLIANSGTGATSSDRASNTNLVSAQIAQLAATYPIKGIMGWPYSGQVLTSNPVLAAAHLPMVSSSASSDDLSAKPYFFRVAPPNIDQAVASAKYATKTLNAKQVAVFYDDTDSYSATLGTNFMKEFESDSGEKVTVKKYTIGAKTLETDMISLLNDALREHPDLDLIYFAGYSEDASYLFNHLPSPSEYPKLRILGGDALGVIESYQPTMTIPQSVYGRFYYTAFAHPDTWSRIGSTNPFYCFYTQDFDPHVECPGPYTNMREHFNRPDAENMLGYDAMLVLLTGATTAIEQNGVTFSPEKLQDAMSNIRGAQAIQGVTGQISLGGGSDPVNKTIVILSVDTAGNILLAPNGIQGCFLLGTCG